MRNVEGAEERGGGFFYIKFYEKSGKYGEVLNLSLLEEMATLEQVFNEPGKRGGKRDCSRVPFLPFCWFGAGGGAHLQGLDESAP